MTLARLRGQNFRCLDAIDIFLHPRRNFVFGPNGAGKTSLLEAIHVIGRGRSFRTRENRRLVQRGTEAFILVGDLLKDSVSERVGVRFEQGALDLRIGGKAGQSASALARLLPVHVIDPSLHALIDGGPSERRRFLDWGVFHVEQSYLDEWRRYRRILSQRNAALKAAAADRELMVWTEQLISAGRAVTRLRAQYVESLSPRLHHFSEALLGDRVEIDYRPGWAGEKTFQGALEDSLSRDRQRGTTRVGPHRADLVLSLGGAGVRNEASRGQQKLVAAALILAQVMEFAEKGADSGILLVDDPAAELDTQALGRLKTVLEELPGQIVMTGLSPALLEPLPDSRVFHVEQGKLKSVYNISV